MGRNKHVTARPKKQETPEKGNHSNITDDLNSMLIPSKSYKKSVPMTISMGASSIDIKYTCKAQREVSRTDKGKDVPRKLTDSIYVSGH